MARDSFSGRFPRTRRSAVASVGSDDPAERARSFDVLVRAYTKPAYKHVRVRSGRSVDDARELVQSFFARAFESRWFSTYDPQKALFRTYFKTCLDRFVMEEAKGANRQKRGGGAMRFAIDVDAAESELQRLGPPNKDDLEAYFDAEWTRSLLGASVDTLSAECVKAGKQVHIAVFRRYVLDREEGVSYASLAAEHGISVTDVTNHLSWARREFRRVVLEHLREITATDEEFRSEARSVLGVDP
jgi:DNA-directed RNA polymerase specialized sigma24 family protein